MLHYWNRLHHIFGDPFPSREFPAHRRPRYGHRSGDDRTAIEEWISDEISSVRSTRSSFPRRLPGCDGALEIPVVPPIWYVYDVEICTLWRESCDKRKGNSEKPAVIFILHFAPYLRILASLEYGNVPIVVFQCSYDVFSMHHRHFCASLFLRFLRITSVRHSWRKNQWLARIEFSSWGFVPRNHRHFFAISDWFVSELQQAPGDLILLLHVLTLSTNYSIQYPVSLYQLRRKKLYCLLVPVHFVEVPT